MYVAFHSETQWQREVIIQGYHWLQLKPPLLVITVIIKMSIIFYQTKDETICKSFQLCLIKNAKDKKWVLKSENCVCFVMHACVFFQYNV